MTFQFIIIFTEFDLICRSCRQNSLLLLLHFSVGLQWLRGTIEVHDEMDEMRAENEAMKVIPPATLKEMLSNPMLRIPLGISVMIMLCQQLSGINAVSFMKNKSFYFFATIFICLLLYICIRIK